MGLSRFSLVCGSIPYPTCPISKKDKEITGNKPAEPSLEVTKLLVEAMEEQKKVDDEFNELVKPVEIYLDWFKFSRILPFQKRSRLNFTRRKFNTMLKERCSGRGQILGLGR